MAGSVNKCILVGNVGKDPEIRATSQGGQWAGFSLATSETWRDKATGERKERTQWHNIVVYNENIVKVVEQYVRKGSKLFLEGQIETREYTDRDGQQRRTTEIVLRQFRGELTLLGDAVRRDPDAGSTPRGLTGREARPSAPATGRMSALIDDDIPF